MTRVVISGYYGSGNTGDEAMLTAILADLRSRVPDARVVVVSRDPEATAATHGVSAVGRLELPGLVRSLRRCDLFVSGGGSLLQDVTSDRNLWYQLFLLNLARTLAPRVMLYGNGIGPIRSRLGWQLAIWTLNRLDAITVRDRKSLNTLRSRGVTKPRVVLAADPALLYPHVPDPVRGRRLLAEAGVDSAARVLAIAPRPWNDPGYVQVLARTCDLVGKSLGVTVVSVAMQHPADVLIARTISQQARHQTVIIDRRLDTAEQLDLLSAVDMVVGMRLHALVLAAIAGVVPVGVAYDPKVSSFLAELGLEPGGTLPGLQLEDLVLKIEQTWQERGRLSAQVRDRLASLRSRALLSGEEAALLLGKVKGT